MTSLFLESYGTCCAPLRISDKIADFFHVDRGTKMTTSQVMGGVDSYIRNNCVKIDSRKFHPDCSLAELLNYTRACDDPGISVFDLPKLLRPVFYMEDGNSSPDGEKQWSNEEQCYYYRSFSTGRVQMAWWPSECPPPKTVKPLPCEYFMDEENIHNKLADFLGIAHSTKLSVNQVMEMLDDYIVANSLQDEVNDRVIHRDDKLTELVPMKYDDQFTYYKLKNYISRHYIQNDPVGKVSADANFLADSDDEDEDEDPDVDDNRIKAYRIKHGK